MLNGNIARPIAIAKSTPYKNIPAISPFNRLICVPNKNHIPNTKIPKPIDV